MSSIFDRPHVHLEIPMLHTKLGDDFDIHLHEQGNDPAKALAAHAQHLRNTADHLEQLATQLANVTPEDLHLEGDSHWISVVTTPELGEHLLEEALLCDPVDLEGDEDDGEGDDVEAPPEWQAPPGTVWH